MSVLRKYIRTVLSERGPAGASAFFSGKGPGTVWDEEQEKYKEEYEALKAFQDLWKKENEKYEKYFKGRTAAQKKSFARENPDITLDWPTWPGTDDATDYQAGSKIEKAVNKALTTFKEYDPRAGSGKLEYTKSSGAKSEADKVLPPEDKKVYLPIEDVNVGTWTPWPKQVRSSGKSYGSSKENAGDTKSGVGPGEEWLSFIFGGQTQGPGVSFDVVTQDGRTWEVKAIESMSDTIRPGTHGLKVFEKPRQKLISILRQLKNFVIVAKKLKFLDVNSPLNDDQRAIISFAGSFLDVEKEMIVDKGEISAERFKSLRSALREVSLLKKQIQKNEKISDPEKLKTKIGLNNKDYEVDKQTFIDVVRKVKKVSPEDVEIPDLEILLSTLKDPAFDDPTSFINEFFDSVKPAEVFSQTSGIFIVTPQQFMMIPKQDMNDYLKFVKVTQGKPRFAVGQGSNSESE